MPEFKNSCTCESLAKNTQCYILCHACRSVCCLAFVAEFWYLYQVIFPTFVFSLSLYIQLSFCNYHVSAQIVSAWPHHISNYIEHPINYVIDLTVLRYLTIIFLYIHLQLILLSVRSFISFSLTFSMPHYGKKSVPLQARGSQRVPGS